MPPDENALGLLLCSATLPPDDGDLAILKTSRPFLVGAMYSSGSNPPPPTLLGVDLDLLDDEVDLFRGSLREIRGGFEGAMGGVALFFCIRCG